MSTKKPLPPPVPKAKDSDRDRIRAAIAGSTARNADRIDGVVMVDGKLVQIINVNKNREPAYIRHIVHKLEMKNISQQHYQSEVKKELDVDEAVLIKYLKSKELLYQGVVLDRVCFVSEPVYHYLPSMSREQVISLSDRMYSRTLEDMQGEMYDDAE